jgi:capsid assembly protease
MNARAVRSYMSSRQWAMEPAALQATAELIAAALEKMPAGALEAAAKAPPAAEVGPGYEVRDNVAHVRIAGPILKEVPCIFGLLGMQATSTTRTQKAIEAALADPAVASLALDIDSPGGSLAGVQELADTIAAAALQKPVAAHASDMAASAAYWLGCQATTFSANESAMIGSIGVYSVMEDSSAAAAAEGVRVLVIRSHELKGAGVEGAPITPAQVADAQRTIDAAANMFMNAVARGRQMSVDAVKALATGQVWFAEQARELGLLDDVMNSDVAHSRAVRGQGVVIDHAPNAGAQETGMENKANASAEAIKLAEMEAALAQAQAEATVLRENVKASQARERVALVDKYADRVAPAARESVLKYGEFCAEDMGKFEAFLKTMPAVTRTTRESAEAPVAPVSASEGEAQVAKWLGSTPARIARFEDVKGFRSDGTFELNDGSVVTKEQLKALSK